MPTVAIYVRKSIRDTNANVCICAHQPASELHRFRQGKIFLDATNRTVSQSLNLHGGSRSTETQLALPRRWKWDSPLSCMIRPDVDIRLVDCATQHDSPMESEAAAPPKHTAVVADVPDTRKYIV